MKVVFINRFFYPDHSATSQLLTDLAFYLARVSIDVCVVAGRQTYDGTNVLLNDREVVQGVHIIRIWTSRFGRQRLWGRAIDYGTFYLSALWCLLRILRPGHVVIAKTDPPLISVVAALVAQLRGATLINWIQDLFPEVASALAMQGSGWLERPLRMLRNQSLTAARLNVVIGEGMAGKLREECIPSDRVSVIHNWADGRAIQPIDRRDNELRRQWNLDDKFVVGYSGNFGRAHEFDTILSAAEILQGLTGIVFLFIGDGAHLASMKQTVERNRLPNVVFKPYQPRDRLSVSLGVPDMHVISLRPALEGLIVPSKFYGIAAAGRPMLYIGNKEGELSQEIRRAQCGFTVDVHQANEAAAVIREAARSEHLCRRLGRQARRLFDERFDRCDAEKTWERVIKEALATR